MLNKFVLKSQKVLSMPYSKILDVKDMIFWNYFRFLLNLENIENLGKII